MDWQRIGRIYTPQTDLDWLSSHAQLPVPLRLEGNKYRVYFAGRGDNNMAQVGFTEFDLSNPKETDLTTTDPVVKRGPLGTFDDSGVFPTSVVPQRDRIDLYYIGWMQGKRVPFYASVGLASSTDGGETFEKESQAPHLPRTSVDPYMTLSSEIRKENDHWKMWYTSATGWETNNDGARPNYHIKYAESSDGRNWNRDGTVAIDYQHENEWAIARPSILKRDSGYEMWYSYVRGDAGYRIGYATSDDGKNWTRHDADVVINPPEEGWDSEMQAYPYVFTHGNEVYMLYNGNDYGREGFGLAKLLA